MRTRSLHMSSEQQIQERRREPRRAVRGRVRLRPHDHLATALTAELLDTSASGFRARHDCPTLTTGQTVWFQSEEAEGHALVIWTRMLGAEVESGFAFLAHE